MTAKTDLLPEQTLLLTEVIVKVAALERLLIKAKIVSNEELVAEIKKIADEISGYIAAQNFTALKTTNPNEEN